MKIFKAIGLGLVAGVVVGGIMAYRRSKKVQEKVNEVFNEEFVNNVVNDILNNIKERHEKLDEEIKKMEENTGNLEKTVEELHNDKIVPPVVEEIKITDEEKLNHEKNQKILEETEKKLDDLLEDLAK